MWKAILFILLLVLVLSGLSYFFLIPPQEKVDDKIASIVEGAQGVMFLVASVLTFFSALRLKALQGLVGVGLRFVSLGLLFFGFAFMQIPFMDRFSLWNTAYYTQSYYYAPDAFAVLFLLIGFIIASLTFRFKALITAIILGVIAVIARVILGFLAKTDGYSFVQQSQAQFGLYLTLMTVLMAVMALIVVFSFLLRRSFGTSKVGSIFTPMVIGNLLILLLGGMTIHWTIVGGNPWYVSSGLYYLVLFASGICFMFSGLRLRYFKV